MTANSPEDDPEKSRLGSITDGFDFLGCSVRTNGVAPSKKTRINLLDDVRRTLSTGNQAVETYASAGEAKTGRGSFRPDDLSRGSEGTRMGRCVFLLE